MQALSVNRLAVRCYTKQMNWLRLFKNGESINYWLFPQNANRPSGTSMNGKCKIMTTSIDGIANDVFSEIGRIEFNTFSHIVW